jgi:hypothetical protein
LISPLVSGRENRTTTRSASPSSVWKLSQSMCGDTYVKIARMEFNGFACHLFLSNGAFAAILALRY